MGNWDVVGFIFISLVTYVSNNMIIKSIELGVSKSYYQDILWINLFVQLLITFWRKGWWVYIVVPSYLGYYILKFLWGYLSSSTNKYATPEEA